MTNVVLMNILLLWLISIFNLLLILAVIRRMNSSKPTHFSSPPTIEGGLKIGDEVPNFTGIDLKGGEVSKEDFANQKFTLVFITPDCQPCREHLPILETLMPLARSLGIKFYLVGLGELEALRSLINELNISITTIVPQGNESFTKDFRVMYTPSFYLIDEGGKIAAGGAPDAQTLTTVWQQF